VLNSVVQALAWLWHPDLILLIQRIFGPGWRTVFEGLSLLGGAQIPLVAVAWARWYRGRDLAYRLLLVLFLSIAVDSLIWNLFPTPRPDDPRIRIASDIPISSFPSGHLVTVMVLWGTLALARVVPGILVPMLAVLVALARLGRGGRATGGVLGGLVVGGLLLAISAAAWRPLRQLAARLGVRRGMVVAVIIALAALAAATITPQGRWSLLGVLAGAALALPLDVRAREGQTAPAAPHGRRDGWRAWLATLMLGAGGLVPLGLLARAAHGVPLLAEWVIPALAALWILYAAPRLMAHYGLGPAHTGPEGAAPLAHDTAHP
jgi:hypothetical protein